MCTMPVALQPNTRQKLLYEMTILRQNSEIQCPLQEVGHLMTDTMTVKSWKIESSSKGNSFYILSLLTWNDKTCTSVTDWSFSCFLFTLIQTYRFQWLSFLFILIDLFLQSHCNKAQVVLNSTIQSPKWNDTHEWQKQPPNLFCWR